VRAASRAGHAGRHGGQPSLLDLDAQLGELDNPDFDVRYELGEALGKGGMGDVRVARIAGSGARSRSS